MQCLCSSYLLTRAKDHVGDNDYGPTPPPEILTTGAPILTSDEYDNNRLFLDFFTTNDSESSVLLDTFEGTSQDVLPNFQGISSAFGHPDLIQYEYPVPSSAPFGQVLNEVPYVENTAFYPLKNTAEMMNTGDQREATYQPIPDKGYKYDGDLYDPSTRARCPTAHTVNQDGPLYSQRTELGFGSDSCFANQPYTPPPGTEDIKAVEGRILESLSSLEPSHIAADTQPSGLLLPKKKQGLVGSGPTRSGNSLGPCKRSQESEREGFAANTPTVDGFEGTEPRKKMKVRKERQCLPAMSHPQRRKCRTAEPKRQNLTDREKKENHIKSEQKRRNQIKEGFANLLAMMPDGTAEGNSNSNSKCIVLSKAVDWLIELRDGNKKLTAQLRFLEGTSR
ncbi:MAG: hypothetical protein LQ340_006077 [Diploschistes diacapsis]|nr:MAG: hypothetical protein LQ340_006077 [Diploschistes diacapsis]